MMAKPYQEAKNVLRAYLLQKGFGSWQDKVLVSDNFSMWIMLQPLKKNVDQ